jgi:hypothetical protein
MLAAVEDTAAPQVVGMEVVVVGVTDSKPRPHPTLLEQQIEVVEAGVLLIQAQVQQVVLVLSLLNTKIQELAYLCSELRLHGLAQQA